MRFAAVLLAALLAACGPAAQAEPAIWRIKDADGTITLFGSVHLLPPGLDWRSARLDRALASADEIWTEIPPAPAWNGAAAAEAARLGALPAGQSLIAELSPQGRERLARLAKSLNVPLEQLDRMEPWLAEIALAVAFHRAHGAVQDAGVEEAVEKAVPEGARRRAFETASDQIALFDGAPVQAQLASLEYALKEMEDDPGLFDRLVRSWADGDVCALKHEALDPLQRAAPAIYQRLIVERNRRWADRLAEVARGGGDVVVVVGAGHLAGPDGLPALLRARGLKVEGPADRCS
ncbi:TraB/GumN family protein [Caulobacter sp. 17J80-11]|uniref:TraB/GumN family protein n=1 Tax=Caulobacter sp. 17J80-11 TaxID=2763502 RepID=UPI001653DE21|nr:TraB/GumN family protein [Caulobacter sp. 17J80-11]